MRVPGFGPSNAKIVIVGEAPGEDEERLGEPFVGASGKFLNSLLSSSGINRHECYLTNVAKLRPPANNFETFYLDGPAKTSPSPMLRQFTTDLHAELRGLRPNVIIPLGGEALRAVTNKLSIDKWRGSILPSPFGKVVASYHPARVLREFSLGPVLEHDLRRAREESEFPEIKDLGHRLELNPSYERVVKFLTDLLTNPRPIAFDIETTGDHVRCLGLADSSRHAICIPFMSFSRSSGDAKKIFIGPVGSTVSNSHWEEAEEYEILRLLDRVFSSRAIGKYAQNFPFDSTVLGREFGFRIHGLRLDTLVAAHTMYPELRKSLDFLASLYTKVPYYSDYDGSVDEELWRYNCYDAAVTYEISDILVSDLKERSASTSCSMYSSFTFQENHIQPAMIVMTRVGRRGLLCDKKVRDDLRNEFETEAKVYLEEFHHLAGGPVNPKSPKQMNEFLYSKMKFPLQYKGSGRNKKVTTDTDALEDLQRKFPHHSRLFDVLLELSELHKLIGTYCQIPLTSDGRLITSYNVVGAVTGRCNSTRTLDDYGTNLQNIPIRTKRGQKLRRMFRADDDYSVVKCDLSQAEWRLMVWFANIKWVKEKYLSGADFDIHRMVASRVYRVEEVSVVKLQRDLAKNGIYGANYDIQPPKASKTWKVPLADAKFMLSALRQLFPEIPCYWRQLQSTLNSTRTLISPLGRVRVFMDRLDESTFRDSYSHSCQCVVADLIHRAVILSELILGDGCRPVLQVHDELVFLCLTKELGHYLPLIQTIMEYPLTIPNVPEPLTIPAELSYGPNWLDQTKWHVGDAISGATNSG